MNKLPFLLRYIAVLYLILLTQALSSQNNIPIRYEALVTNEQSEALANKKVSLLIKIDNYEESHTTRTNASGIASIEIGRGQVINGDYSLIAWTSHEVISIRIDPSGGRNYTLNADAPILSVPYANLAVSSADINDADSNPTNEIELPTIANSGSVAFFDEEDGWSVLSPGNEGDFLSSRGGVLAWKAADEFCFEGLKYDFRLISYNGSYLPMIEAMLIFFNIESNQAVYILNNLPSVIAFDINSCDALEIKREFESLGAVIELRVNSLITCTDFMQNGDETGIDCGGSLCEPCPPTCTDGIRNGNETRIDCGGTVCDPCPTKFEVWIIYAPNSTSLINFLTNLLSIDNGEAITLLSSAPVMIATQLSDIEALVLAEDLESRGATVEIRPLD